MLIVIINPFRVKSKADFTMRKSLHTLVKFLPVKITGNSVTGPKSCLLVAERRGFVSEVFSFASALGGLHHSL